MKKYTIDLNKLSVASDPISYLNKLFGFHTNKDCTLKSLSTNILSNNEDIYRISTV